VPSSPTSRQFRDSVGMFATGITVLTARADGSGHGMTANAFASVSLDPLLVLVCVERDAVMHKVLQEVGRFAVSVLAGDQEDLARYFSDPGRPKSMAQFLPVPWRPGPVTGAPLLELLRAVSEYRGLFSKFVRPNGQARRSWLDRRGTLAGRKIHDPQAILTSTIRFRYLIQDSARDRIVRPEGDLYAEMVNYVKDLTLTRGLRALLSEACERPGCVHVPARR